MEPHVQSAFSPFSYAPLDKQRRTIRVVRIKPSHGIGTIELDLEHIKLEKDTYVCLSYTWGQADEGDDILITSRYITQGIFRARKNLHDFLVQARKLMIQDWLWIDAICIDQSDDEERGHQVRLMTQIYSQARHVLVYPGGRSSECLDNFVDNPVRPIERIEGKIPSTSQDHRKHLLDCTSEESWISTNVEDLHTYHLDDFFKEEYWERMWIIQEMALAQKAYVVTKCGLLCLDCITMIARKSYTRAVPKAVLGLRRLTKGTTAKPSMAEAIAMFAGSKCQEENDHVYALLWLENVPDNFPIDYRRKKTVLALDIIQHFDVFRQHLLPSLGMRYDREAAYRSLSDAFRRRRWDVAMVCWSCYQQRFKVNQSFLSTAVNAESRVECVWFAADFIQSRWSRRAPPEDTYVITDGYWEEPRVMHEDADFRCALCKQALLDSDIQFRYLQFHRLHDNVLLMMAILETDTKKACSVKDMLRPHYIEVKRENSKAAASANTVSAYLQGWLNWLSRPLR